MLQKEVSITISLGKFAGKKAVFLLGGYVMDEALFVLKLKEMVSFSYVSLPIWNTGVPDSPFSLSVSAIPVA